MTLLLQQIVLKEDVAAPAAVLVFLHGYGATVRDLAPIAQMAPASCRKLLLQAPFQVPGAGSAWAGLAFTPGGLVIGEADVHASLGMLRDDLRELRAQAPGVPFFLIGFSQGAGMSLLTALSTPGLVDGVICFSGLLPEAFAADVQPAQADKPVALWVGHGLQDDVLPISYARQIRSTLEANGYRFSYREYPARHEISVPMLTDAYAWLAQQLGA